MSLISLLTLTLGPIIAKALLTLWLSEKSVLLSSVTNLVDLIAPKIKDAITQKKLSRQFEEMGEKVAESLLPLFEKEGVEFENDTLSSIIEEVSKTINEAKITTKLLIRNNLEPELLLRYLLKSNGNAIKIFSKKEFALYKRVLDELSQRIVDTSARLPNFSENLSKEIYKGSRQLVENTDQILEELRKLRLGIQKKDESLEAILFEEKYKLQIARKLDFLTLFGVDISRSSRRHSLSIAYIKLTVSKNIYVRNNLEFVEKNKDSNDNIVDIISIDEALVASKRLLIRGDAGSGKTTLLQWIAVNSAYRKFKGSLTDWNNTIPFFIRLRDYANLTLPTPELFPKPIVPLIYNQMPKNWVHKQLESDKAILLIDGVDEVPKQQRDSVCKWLNDLVITFPKARYIVTSRPHALEEGWKPEGEFYQSELLPMDLNNIYRFIDHWHNAVKMQTKNIDEKENFKKLSDKLKEIIKTNKPLRRIAVNPLLCAMICALHRDRCQKLPSNRIELYQACTHMLLERRDEERGVKLFKEYITLSYTQKRYLLENFAYWLLKNNWTAVSTSQTDEHFNYKLSQMNNIPSGAKGPDVRTLMVERSGIIREAVQGQIDFAHKTFQEFLSASAAINERDIGLLEQNAHNDQWRETIILACGLARGNLANDLLNRIIKRGDAEKEERHKLHLLAMACLETSIELNQELKMEIEKRLEGLIPPKNNREANILASTGDLAVPFLVNKNHDTSVNLACIQALIEIGSEDALTVLESYRDIDNSSISETLLKGWDEFPIEEYATRILTNFKKIRSDSLEKVQYIPNLEELILTKVVKSKPLEKLKNLMILEINNCQKIDSLKPLSKLKNLISISLSHSDSIKDIEFVKNLKNLKSISITNFKCLSNLKPLSELNELMKFKMYNCDNLINLECLANLSKLKSIQIIQCNKINKLDFLSKNSTLEYIEIIHCPQIIDISPLSIVKTLKDIHVYPSKNFNIPDNLQKYVSTPGKQKREKYFKNSN